MLSNSTTNNNSSTDINCLVSVEGYKNLINSDNGEGLYWTSDPTVELPIKISSDTQSMSSLKPLTVLDVFHNAVNTYPNRIALRVERPVNNKWKEWTYRSYYNDCKRFAKSLLSLTPSFNKFDRINIIGFNSPEWLIADVGTIMAGGIAAGIYTTNAADSCHYITSHSKAKIVVVEDTTQTEKFIEIMDDLPNLQYIIQYSGTINPTHLSKYPNKILSWSKWLEKGNKVNDQQLTIRMNNQRPGMACTLIYTSGTTGKPKAVMLSHDNITWTARILANSFDLSGQNERIVSYLPLSHIAAQMSDIHAPMLVGGTVSFARPDALKGSIVDTLTSVKPTVFFGVPRVWEKIEEKMRSVGANNTGLKKSIGDWAKDIGLKGNKARLKGKNVPWGWSIANKIVFENVQKALGLDQCNIRITGAAPITIPTVEYFMSLDMPLAELYGMSESTGPHTLNLPGATKIGSVGKSMAGTITKINNKNKNGEGEILMKGRHIMMGYMFNPEATMKTIDKNGYLYTGDLGMLDADDFLKITGRIKELIITAGGENIPPVLIEDAIKLELPCISNIMVIGDQRKYLTCLITLKTELNEHGEPTTQLAPISLEFIAQCGSNITSTKQLNHDLKVKEAIMNGIERANMKATSRAQRVQKCTFLINDFTVSTNELTPTMKLKRRIVAEKYKELIDAMYQTQISAKL